MEEKYKFMTVQEEIEQTDLEEKKYEYEQLTNSKIYTKNRSNEGIRASGLLLSSEKKSLCQKKYCSMNSYNEKKFTR